MDAATSKTQRTVASATAGTRDAVQNIDTWAHRLVSSAKGRPSPQAPVPKGDGLRHRACGASFNWMSQLVSQPCSSSARRNQKRWMIMNVSTVYHVMAKFSWPFSSRVQLRSQARFKSANISSSLPGNHSFSSSRGCTPSCCADEIDHPIHSDWSKNKDKDHDSDHSSVSSLKAEPYLAQRTVAKMISCAPQAKQIETSECWKRDAREIMSRKNVPKAARYGSACIRCRTKHFHRMEKNHEVKRHDDAPQSHEHSIGSAGTEEVRKRTFYSTSPCGPERRR